jgi:hypothetical protein
MSKKLIAVASAAALALTGLVGVAPASASTPTITLDATAFVEGGQTGATTDLANTIPVPADNAIVYTATPVTGDTGRGLDFANLAVDDVITVTTTGGVEVLSSVTGLGVASSLWDVTSLGKTSLTKTVTTAGTDTLYFYTTSTAVGTAVITVTRAGSSAVTVSKTYYFKGIAGPAYNLTSVTGVPDTLANTKTANFSFKLTDVFGNNVASITTIGTSDITGTTAIPYVVVPSTVSMRAGASAYYSSSAGEYQATITSGSSSATVFDMYIDRGEAAGKQDADVLGFATANNTFVAILNNPAAATANATATAQIAALTIQLAASRPIATSVTKKKYNKLARKWNAAFPSQKVALKK